MRGPLAVERSRFADGRFASPFSNDHGKHERHFEFSAREAGLFV
jgi:hypothetical protein